MIWNLCSVYDILYFHCRN